MQEQEKLNVFISYSHKNQDEKVEFLTHLSPLKDLYPINIWEDQKIIPGEDYQKEINANIENSDIILLLISADYFNSDACKKEKDYAIRLKKQKNIWVIPVILSACAWQDDEEISSMLALPTDGQEISKFDDKNTAWMDVYTGLKRVIDKVLIIRKMKTSSEHSGFLENTELLSKSHTKKEKIILKDIFVFPEVSEYNYDESITHKKPKDIEQVMKKFYDYRKICIAGENQSGKTTICKKFWIYLREQNYVPIYVFDEEKSFQGKIENRIKKSFQKQYDTDINIDEIDKDKIVLLIDDFHFARDKNSIGLDLKSYCNQILIVDDIFNLNFRSEELTKSFKRFKLNEFTPSRRDALIRKWLQLTDGDPTTTSVNNDYADIDRTTELVNSALGKVLGKGIMPAYPFFILMLISIGETLSKPLEHEITSQGHCYQALIYNYLRKENVKNNEIDTYINFLTQLASYIYEKQELKLSPDNFDVFMNLYKDKYNLPVSEKVLLSNLHKTKIFSKDSIGNYSFCYSYIYFFFVAKYLANNLADNLGNSKDKIRTIISNLHKDDNAYIAAFVSHHSESIFLLNEIVKISSKLFQDYKPSKLDRQQLHFFDQQIDVITRASFPKYLTNPELERKDRLKVEDELEQDKNDKDMSDDPSQLILELRRGIKTVEVMGMIIKNRAGSLETQKLESIFESAMQVHLRLMTSFIEIIKKKETQQIVIDFIGNQIELLAKHQDKPLNSQEMHKLSRLIFWNLNFRFLYGFINKTIHSLGSSQLTKIIRSVCERENTPVSCLIMHGIFMWYNKNLQTDEIVNKVDSHNFSKVARAIAEHQIVNHCRLHQINYKDRQKIEEKLKIPKIHLLSGSSKK